MEALLDEADRAAGEDSRRMTYEEYDKRRHEFKGLKITDSGVREHMEKLNPLKADPGLLHKKTSKVFALFWGEILLSLPLSFQFILFIRSPPQRND